MKLFISQVFELVVAFLLISIAVLAGIIAFVYTAPHDFLL